MPLGLTDALLQHSYSTVTLIGRGLTNTLTEAWLHHSYTYLHRRGIDTD